MLKVTEGITNPVNIHCKVQENLFKFGRGYVTGLQLETTFLVQSKFYAELALWRSTSFSMLEIASKGCTLRVTDN